MNKEATGTAANGFPRGFVWGAGTSACQVEGAAEADGKGLSIWDVNCLRPGTVWRGQTGQVACDHYRRYREDVALMKRMGLQAYRFSVSWPRVRPDGTGAVNARGLDFYSRLVDELLAAGIAPWVTLFHWDLPHELYCRGGWLNADSPDWLADYTRTVVEALSDRVGHWITINEPQAYAGMWLPGDRLKGDKSMAQVLRAGHNILLGHGRAVQAIRAAAKGPSAIGWAPAGSIRTPATERESDVEAARRATFGVDGREWRNNSWWMDPVFLGRYPEEGLAAYGASVPAVRTGDMETISQPLDFCGINIYTAEVVRAGDDGRPEAVPWADGSPMTAMDWDVNPACLYWGPRFMFERYRRPVVITENGMANVDWVACDGKVHDPQRIDYLTTHLRELARAIGDRIEVAGYFHWSLLDNFEWGSGYRKRFGLVHVDYPTQRRTLKDSADWYSRLIATNGGILWDGDR